MSRMISLKSRVRYEGRVQTIDRRGANGAELEKPPDHVWRTVGLILRSKFKPPLPAAKTSGKINGTK